jgi:ribosomal protein S18 acetylase RimI-like enzyme
MKEYFNKEIRLNEVDILEYRNGGGNTVEIFNIAVNSKPRVGIGSKMIAMLEQKRLGNMFAITHSENLVAQRFYEKNRFVGTRLPNFYQVYPPYSTGDAIMYVKQCEKL